MLPKGRGASRVCVVAKADRGPRDTSASRSERILEKSGPSAPEIRARLAATDTARL